MFKLETNALIYELYGELIKVEAHGDDSLRVRAIQGDKFIDADWALDEEVATNTYVELDILDEYAYIRNGNLICRIENTGKITFLNQNNEVLLEEFVRNRADLDKYCSCLHLPAREWRAHPGTENYDLKVRFEADADEQIFGMGQYQHGYLDQKYSNLLLEQRNSQISIPFMISSKNYGFFWNNPAVGDVNFAKNLTQWHSRATKQMDYWITAKATPKAIQAQFMDVVGKPPLMPDFAMGFWQSKLRYQTQEELLNVAREYKKRGLPISVIVIDFFHWTEHGEWKFDNDYWPDPQAMVDELHEMGIEPMVSVWPTVAKTSENYEEMLEKDLLVKNDMGLNTHSEFMGNSVFIDTTKPEAREYLWSKLKENYYDYGIKLFWFDTAEPEYEGYDFPIYRYHIGPALETSNFYPRLYSKSVYKGLENEGEENIIHLVRSAWAGSQKYGALVWSGDVDSSFRGLREQFVAGLNIGIAGIPWWTSDIGGFLGGYTDSPDFHELIVRWFQYSTFCPVLRLHGERLPHKEPLGTTGGGAFFSGADNEVWSFGEETYEILKKYLELREKLQPYISELMKEAHELGTPVIRTLFFEYPEDNKTWDINDQMMFGSDVLVAPIMNAKARSRKVYLPKGDKWKNTHTGEVFAGGQEIEVAAPIDVIPVFTREDADIDIKI